MLRTLHTPLRTMFVLLTIILVLIAYSALRQVFSPDMAEVPPADAIYRDPSYAVDVRVEDLLSRMTLAEKIGQMALVEKNSMTEVTDVARYGIGAMLSGGGAVPEDNTSRGWSEMIQTYTAQSRASRLGIPLLYGVDANHGHSNVRGATVFPHAIGLGATNDPDLVERVARATAEELVATGVYWSYSPSLDLPQDIRWGRVYEAFSDDPARAAVLGAAYVRGTEGADEGRFVLSTPKHYIGVGGMAWGTSGNESYRIDQGVTPADAELLRDVYLPPFKAAVDEGAGSVMVGLNSWGDGKLSASKYLITDVLKGELGFTGFVVSDWYGVYEIPEDKYNASVIAINAGVDMVMLPFNYKNFVRDVTYAVRWGAIPEARIDDAVRRILRTKFELGLFDEPRALTHTAGEIGTDAHRALAREAVAASLVLLKDEESVLPITDDVSRIHVAGSAADNIGKQSGGWTVAWQGIDGNGLPGATSILEGIRERAGNTVAITYDAEGDFLMDSERADIGIAIVGEDPYAEGVGDREYPILYAEDLLAIKKLQASSERVIVILVSGRPLLIENEIDSWDAVVAAWLPGSEGAGVADVLFGDKPFTGTLPLPWPAKSEQLPILPDGTTADGTPVLFPRGAGILK